MVDPEFSIEGDFPAASYSQWQELVEASLRGSSFEEQLVTQSLEGIQLLPLYSEENTSAVDSGLTRTDPADWDLQQVYCEPEPDVLNRILRQEVEGGVSSLEISLDQAGHRGLDPDNAESVKLVGLRGTMVYSAADLSAVLDGVDLKTIAITLRAGASFLPAAAMLVAACQAKDCGIGEVRFGFGGDPLGVLAREGRLPMSLENAFSQLANLAHWTAEHSSDSAAIGVDLLPYHDTGATAVQELAFATATAVQYLRVLTASGMALESAARQVEFSFGLGTHHFTEIAKLRAARMLWARIIEAFGGNPEGNLMKIQARLGRRALTVRDAEMNILRNTTAVFAAGIGGADAVTSVPFDSGLEGGSEFSRRLARNTAIILQREAHLHRVDDPARGSWFLESITNDLASKAWQEFQAIEGQGGMAECLLTGRIAELVNSASQERAQSVSSAAQAIVGVSVFPNPEGQSAEVPRRDLQKLRETAVQRMSSLSTNAVEMEPTRRKTDAMEAVLDAAANGAALGQMATMLGFHQQEVTAPKLQPRRLEELYDATLGERDQSR